MEVNSSTWAQTKFPKIEMEEERNSNWKSQEDTNSVKLFGRVIKRKEQVEESEIEVVVLHGLMGNGNHFKSFAENLIEENTKVRRVFLVDLRNHGLSDHHQSMTYKELAEDVYRFLIENNLNNFVLFGHSMGAKTAMCFSSYYGNMIKGLVILDTFPLDYSNNPEIWQSTQKLIEFMTTIDLTQYKSRNDLIKYVSDNLVFI